MLGSFDQQQPTTNLLDGLQPLITQFSLAQLTAKDTRWSKSRSAATKPATCRRSSEQPRTIKGWITSLMTTMMIMILMRLETSNLSQTITTKGRWRTLNQQQWQRNQQQSILMFFPLRCSAVYKLDNTTCSSMQLACGFVMLFITVRWSGKTVFRKLVIVYHPDRVDKNKRGEKYHVLCEEITSELSRKYSRYTCWASRILKDVLRL